MSTMRSLKKPKKHGKTVLYIVLAAVVVAGIVCGIVALGKKDNYKVPSAEIHTEIVK